MLHVLHLYFPFNVMGEMRDLIYLLPTKFLESRLAEWLERLDYGVQRVAVRLSVQGWASRSDEWNILPVNPAANGYVFRNRDG